MRKINGLPKGFEIRGLFRYDDNMTTTNQELKKLMSDYDLMQKDVQDLCGRGRTVVYYWTRDESDPNFQEMHPSDLRLLKFELGLARPRRKKSAYRMTAI